MSVNNQTEADRSRYKTHKSRLPIAAIPKIINTADTAKCVPSATSLPKPRLDPVRSAININHLHNGGCRQVRMGGGYHSKIPHPSTTQNIKGVDEPRLMPAHHIKRATINTNNRETTTQKETVGSPHDTPRGCSNNHPTTFNLFSALFGRKEDSDIASRDIMDPAIKMPMTPTTSNPPLTSSSPLATTATPALPAARAQDFEVYAKAQRRRYNRWYVAKSRSKAESLHKWQQLERHLQAYREALDGKQGGSRNAAGDESGNISKEWAEVNKSELDEGDEVEVEDDGGAEDEWVLI